LDKPFIQNLNKISKFFCEKKLFDKKNKKGRLGII